MTYMTCITRLDDWLEFTCYFFLKLSFVFVLFSSLNIELVVIFFKKKMSFGFSPFSFLNIELVWD
jgi:hypothetical protein